METEDNRSTTASTKPKSRSGKAKVFQCQGYGDCRMVFTRSEHLARHMRKHTGEKPFKCIVSGCDRMFSRFDNMMQHTQTHNKSRAKEDSASEPGSQMKETRRLSVQDLCNPIECLENQTAQPNSEEEGVNLTIDEFEAIQGFGRFHAVASTVDN
ncbi:uncharacterized protein BYT42DRAFT_499248 [Radiomyces spectabilis]|uniref:uncharacterized protein n=1 Tax=Radiomyces spectabilis TaxID=64574 RepID=UPI0022204A20|nr:uncharacterized protein BYT42DRAFT_499248 [Radiomyces spectabilis]KAI8374221.1 hypothetical protein BYT42DRAFT_499248 [Radiomyces spectabilis]